MPKLPPVIYLFYGTDVVGLSRAVARIRSSMGDPGLADLNLTRFQGRALSLADLQAACLAAPFLVRRRLVIVEDWLQDRAGKPEGPAAAGEEDEIPVDGESSAGGSPPLPEEVSVNREATSLEAVAHSRDWGAVCSLLEQVPGTTALVLLQPSELSPKHPVRRWCEEHEDRALVRAFDLPRGAGLSAWIMKHAEALGGKMQPEAARLLASLVGEDPRLLDQEVQKLLAYVNYARSIRPEDVERITPESLQLDVFAMVDALGQRDSRKALELVHDLLLKQRPEAVLGMVVRQFRLLIQVREGLEAGRTAGQLAEDLRPSKSRRSWEWITERLVRQARGFSLESLEAVYRKLGDLDASLKTSRIDPETGFDLLVEEVVQVAA